MDRDRGIRSKVRKGRMSALREGWEHAISGKQMDSVQEETLAVSVTEMIVGNEHNCPLLLRMRRHRLTEESLRKSLGPGEKVLLKRKVGRRACQNYFKGSCANPSCDCWHPPVCQNYKSVSGCNHGEKCRFRHVEAHKQPSKKSKKCGGKGPVASLNESIQFGCVSQDSHPRTSTLRKSRKLGSNCTVTFSKRT